MSLILNDFEKFSGFFKGFCFLLLWRDTAIWLNLKQNIEKPVAHHFFMTTEEFKNFSVTVEVQRILHTSGPDFIFTFLNRVNMIMAVF